jgi:hypothetical protein
MRPRSGATLEEDEMNEHDALRPTRVTGDDGRPFGPYGRKQGMCPGCGIGMTFLATEGNSHTFVELHRCPGCGMEIFRPIRVSYGGGAVIRSFDEMALKLRLDHCCSSEAEREEARGWYEILKHGPSGERVHLARMLLFGRPDDQIGPFRATGLSYDESDAIRSRLRQEAAEKGAS